jgi:hypothetical protein
MNRQQRKNFIKSMRVKERLSIAVSMPPKELPIIKEYHIGRNDKCPCQKNMDAYSAFEKWRDDVYCGFIPIDTPCPDYKVLKYKNCCMKSGRYENYKTNK